MDNSTTLRLLQTMPQVLKTQKQNGMPMARPKRPDCLMQPGHGKSHKNKTARNRNKDNGRKKMEKYFIYRCGNLD